VEARLGLETASSRSTDFTDPVGVTPEIRRLAEEGNLIVAIKLYREATGVDLRTAKETSRRLGASGRPRRRLAATGAAAQLRSCSIRHSRGSLSLRHR
jgi:hypothetical protein